MREPLLASTPQTQVLLKEYNVCVESARRLGRSIRQAYAIMGSGSLSILVAVGACGSLELPIVIVVALGVVLLSWIWHRNARRWQSRRRIYLLRAKHVEQDLNAAGMPIYCQQYIVYKDRVRRHADDPFSQPILDIPESRKAELRDSAARHVRGFGGSGWLVFIMNTITWVLYVLYRLPFFEQLLFALRRNFYGS